MAIVGSRNYPDLDAVAAYVDLLPAGTTVVSGGAIGVDQAAEFAATRRGLKVESYHPDWDKNGKAAAWIRNRVIVGACDRLVAFWFEGSHGTADAIARAREAGKPVRIFRAEPGPPVKPKIYRGL